MKNWLAGIAQAVIRKTSSYSCPLLRKWFPNKSKALMQASLQHLSQEKSSHGWTVNMKKAPSRAMGRSWLSVVPPRFRMHSCGTQTSVTGLPVLHYLDPFRTGCSRVNLQKFPSEGLSAGEPSLCHTGTLLYCLCHCVSHMVDGSTFPLVCQVSPGQRQNQHQSCTQRSFPPKPSNRHCPRIISVKFQRNFLSLSWHIQPFMASSVYRQE